MTSWRVCKYDDDEWNEGRSVFTEVGTLDGGLYSSPPDVQSIGEAHGSGIYLLLEVGESKHSLVQYHEVTVVTEPPRYIAAAETEVAPA
jgi:hypothetical protein